MATKGDKAVLAPQAQRLYAEGHNLSSIKDKLGVSVTSLKRWKDATKDPNQPMDEWDRARSQKRGNIQRLRDLFEEQLFYIEGLHASKRDSKLMDALSKMGSLLERWDKMEKAQRVADDVEKVVKKAGLTSDTADEIRRQILGIGA
jgi:transposase